MAEWCSGIPQRQDLTLRARCIVDEPGIDSDSESVVEVYTGRGGEVWLVVLGRKWGLSILVDPGDIDGIDP